MILRHVHIVLIATIERVSAITTRVHKLVGKVLGLNVVLSVHALVVGFLTQPTHELCAKPLDESVQEGHVVRDVAVIA